MIPQSSPRTMPASQQLSLVARLIHSRQSVFSQRWSASSPMRLFISHASDIEDAATTTSELQYSIHQPSTSNTQEIEEEHYGFEDRLMIPSKPDETTGAFQKLPMVAPSKEILDSAMRKASRIGINKKLKNEAAKYKNKAARQFDTLMKELTAPLGVYERGFPQVKRLHPFETALLELTLGSGTYEKVMNKVSTLRKGSVEVAKGYAARCSKAANKQEAIQLQEEGFLKVESVYNKNAAAVDELKEVAKSLRRLPVVDPELPTVALVGAPNVGKSSLVQLLSSGLPEVQNYPFTTRSIKMGHFYVDGRRHQVTDTPGLLARSDEERNAMEKLTLASLQHLPTAVLFVVDLTGECGTSIADQWRIRAELKERFPNKPWVDVFSKADLLEEEFDYVDENRSKFDSISKVEKPMEFIASVPEATRVSSLTGDGIDALKEAMLGMLDEITSTIDDSDDGDEDDKN